MKDQHDQRHNIAINKLINEIKGLYLQTGKKVVQAGAVASMGGKEFKISTSTQYKKMFRVLFNDLQKGIESGIINGVRAEWERGEERAIDTIAKQLRGKLSLEALEKLKQDKFGATAPAYAAFQDRMKNGLKLSDRIWDMTNEYKRDLELLVNINSGRSAQDMAIDLQRFLNDPDHLFRRVRNAAGELEMSKAMANFKPGTGVYRSSYKNALRLARTEVNMAYRRAENARYQSLPFVIGYDVRLSNAHPVFDICDELKGRYPVDFVFSGWHPQCLCFTTAVLSSEEDYEKLEQAILNGEPLPEQKHIVEMPESFNKWVERNKERAGNWKSQPYFIRDNFKGGKLDGGLKFVLQSKKAISLEFPKEFD